MKLGKWKIELIVIVLLAVVGLSVYWFVATKDARAAETELETMIKYAQRQALEIAIIEQASKLANYRQQLTQVQQTKQVNPVMPEPPKIPQIADPVDIK